MKLKSQAKECFINFENEVKRQHNKDIKWVRLDNGGEYGSSELNAYIESKEMLFQPIIPYSPESNEVAERMNRILMAKVRAILVDSKLPTYLWDYLAEMVAYLANRSPCSSIGDVTPYQKRTNEQPDLSHLRVPGCRVWHHLNKEKRESKLSERSEECRLIGYSDSTRIYRLYSVKSRRAFYSQDVTFDEGPLSWLQDGDKISIDEYLNDLSDGPENDKPANEFPATESFTVYRPEPYQSPEDLLATVEKDTQPKSQPEPPQPFSCCHQ